MKAIRVDESSQKLYLGDAAEPPFRDEDLLVSVRAASLNRADLLQKRGLYPPPEGESPILGLEMAGSVERVGTLAGGGWKPGDRVFALLPGGGYAERVSVPAAMAMRIPEGMTFEEAAAVPEAFLTAFLNLFHLGRLKSGDFVLIHAGASGVGTAAIQLVREAGAVSIVTAGSEDKRRVCLKLGAGTAIDYRNGPFAPAVMEATGGRGVDIVLDSVGAPYWEQNLTCLATDGRLIVIGTMGGAKTSGVDLGMLLRRRLQVIGTALRSRSREDKIRLTREFAEFAMPRLADGRLTPVIDSVWDWERADEAHAHMEANKNIGKIVLRVRS